MTDYATVEERVVELEDRLKDAKETLGSRSAAYQHINDEALKEEDDANPEPAPRGEEKCRVDEAWDLADKAECQLSSTPAPSNDVLDGIEQAMEHVEAVIRDTPADESVTRGQCWDDEDGVYAWDEDDLVACAE